MTMLGPTFDPWVPGAPVFVRHPRIDAQDDEPALWTWRPGIVVSYGTRVAYVKLDDNGVLPTYVFSATRDMRLICATRQCPELPHNAWEVESCEFPEPDHVSTGGDGTAVWRCTVCGTEFVTLSTATTE